MMKSLFVVSTYIQSARARERRMRKIGQIFVSFLDNVAAK